MAMQTGARAWDESRQLATDARDRLRRSGIAKPCAPGEVLIRQGERGTHALLLHAGRATVVCANAAGYQTLVAVLGSGSLLGEMAVLDGGLRSATVTAVDHGVVHVIPAPAFMHLWRDDRFADQVMHYTVGNVRTSNALMVDLAHLPVSERLAKMLLRLLDAAGADAVKPEIIPLSQTGLARALGVARSSLAKASSLLAERGLVGISGHKIIVLDPDALRRFRQKPSTSD